MRVSAVASASKFSGAAAVAEMTCRSLRSVGVDGRLLFVGGRNLEARLAREGWAHAGLVKERTPFGVIHNLRVIQAAAMHSDVVISHLPHDHMLCVVAGVHRRAALVRSYRCSKHLRNDPLHRMAARRLKAALLAHSGFEGRLAEAGVKTPSMSFPVPVEDRFVHSVDSLTWRSRLGIPAEAPVLGMVGKLATGRGFDLLLETAALIKQLPQVVAVGIGEARPALERLAQRLGLDDRVHWAGYHEEELPQLYAAMDVVLFAAPGSDHGHRAISEAQACGRPVAAVGIPGVSDLIDDGVTGRVVDGSVESIAGAVGELLAKPELRRLLGERATEAVAGRRFEMVGTRLAEFLRQLR